MSSTLGILSANWAARCLIGGESKRFDLIRQVLAAYTQVVADIAVTIAEGGSSGNPTTLWQSASHGVSLAPMPQQFAAGFILVDPDAVEATALPLDIELAATISGAVTVTTTNMIRRHTRDYPMLLESSITGVDFAAIGTPAAPGAAFAHITRIRARNVNPVSVPVGTNNLNVRLLLLN